MVKAPKKGAPIWNWGAIVGVIATLFIARLLTIGTLNNEPLGGWFVNSSYDLPFGFRDPIPAREAVVIYMDEDSHRVLGQKWHVPWDRKIHAKLIRKLTAEKAKVIVLDILFEESDPQSDAELAAAMKAHGKVVLAALAESDELTSDLGSKREAVVEPKAFRGAASVGLINLEEDRGRFVRRVFRLPPDSALTVPTIAEKAADLSGYAISEKSRKADWLNFFGPARHLPWKSYHRVVMDEGTEPGFFQDKTVFIGLRTAVGFAFDQRDDFDTPYSIWNSEPMSGVEIHATRFLNLIHGNGLHRTSRTTEAFLFALIGIGLGWGLTLVRPLLAFLIAVGTAALIAWVSYFTFKAGYWWPWVISAGVQVPVALGWAVVFNSVRLRIESKTLERSLALHLSPKRARQLSKRPELLQVGGEQQEVSILFSDIANFSTITSRMHPEDLFKLLNMYFETTLPCVHATEGTVVKLIGDAIFAIWNAPLPQEDHAKAAVTAALKMRDQLLKFDTAQHNLPLQTRIGLHMGDACVGNVGSSTRFDYTAIGDSINLASRLEGLNKYLGTMVLGTRDIQRLVEKDFTTRLVGHFAFKGIDRAVEVHEFLGAQSEAEAWRTAFSDALFSFQRKDFEAAAVGFKKTIELRNGEDGPSEFYLAQIDKLAKTELPESWAGEVRLTEK